MKVFVVYEPGNMMLWGVYTKLIYANEAIAESKLKLLCEEFILDKFMVGTHRGSNFINGLL